MLAALIFLDSLYSSFEFISLTRPTPFGGRGAPSGSTMALLGIGRWYFPIGCQYTNRRCIWHRLAAICGASFDWGCEPPVWEWGSYRLEMGPLGSPTVTS